MNKTTIALIVTWVVIGLVGAFLAGYFIAKKYVCIADKPNENVMINNEKPNTLPGANNPTPPPTSTPSISNSNNAVSNNPANNSTNTTVVEPNKQ